MKIPNYDTERKTENENPTQKQKLIAKLKVVSSTSNAENHHKMQLARGIESNLNTEIIFGKKKSLFFIRKTLVVEQRLVVNFLFFFSFATPMIRVKER